jgi:hypothetical protein
LRDVICRGCFGEQARLGFIERLVEKEPKNLALRKEFQIAREKLSAS